MRRFSKIFLATTATVLFLGCFLSVQPAFAGGATLYVYYYGNGSTSGSTVTDSYNSLNYYTVRSNWFVRTGYTFDGWNTNASGTGVNYSPGQTVSYMTQNLTLYAKWKQTSTTISVTYNANGGSGSNITDSVKSGANYTIRQNTFSRSGYVFAGWNTKANGTGTNYTPGQVVCLTSSLTLYAKWTAACSLTVTYCPNGGAGSNVTDYVISGAYYTIRQNLFSRSGYTFAGWNTKANGTGTNYPAGQTICLTNSLTLYAKWSVCALTVTYNPNGGYGSAIVDNVNQSAYYTIRQNTFTRSGYTFAGWNTKANGTGTNYSAGQTICLTSSLTLYAKWTAVCSLTVTYCPNGGSGSNVIDYVNAGAYYTIRQSLFTRNGYVFAGWNTKANGTGTNYSAGQTICLTSSLTLYAKWTVCALTVTYYPNGGSGSTITDNVSQSSYYTIRQNTFTRSGYTFAGWNTKADGSGTNYSAGQSVSLTSSLALYAKWEVCTALTVTYYPNGGTGSTITDSVSSGPGYTIRQNSFTREGFGFVCWNTKADGGGEDYTAGQFIDSLTVSLDLYAKWEASSELTVSYYPNEGTGTTIVDSVKSGASYTIRLNTFTREGYNFDCWNTKPDGGGVDYLPGHYINSLTVSLDLYAKWKPSQLPQMMIIYLPNGGTGSIYVDYVDWYSSYTIKDLNYTMAGHTQNDWNTAADGSGKTYEIGQVITVTTPLVLFAQWVQDSPHMFKVTYHPNGGVGEPYVDEVDPNTLYTIKDSMFKRQGRDFQYWFTDPDHKNDGERYDEGEQIYVTEDMDLYVIWDEPGLHQ